MDLIWKQCKGTIIVNKKNACIIKGRLIVNIIVKRTSYSAANINALDVASDYWMYS